MDSFFSPANKNTTSKKRNTPDDTDTDTSVVTVTSTTTRKNTLPQTLSGSKTWIVYVR